VGENALAVEVREGIGKGVARKLRARSRIPAVLYGRGKEAVSIAWLCDVDPAQIEKMSTVVGDSQSAAPKRTGKYEEVLADRKVDACIIATPHHWHAPIALAAMAAGKDVITFRLPTSSTTADIFIKLLVDTIDTLWEIAIKMTATPVSAIHT